MSPEEFLQTVQNHSEKIASAFERKIPLKVGNAGKSHFKENFRRVALSTKILLNGNLPSV